MADLTTTAKVREYLSLPASGDSTSIKVWQNGASIRIVRSASEDPATFSSAIC